MGLEARVNDVLVERILRLLNESIDVVHHLELSKPKDINQTSKTKQSKMRHVKLITHSHISGVMVDLKAVIRDGSVTTLQIGRVKLVQLRVRSNNSTAESIIRQFNLQVFVHELQQSGVVMIGQHTLVHEWNNSRLRLVLQREKIAIFVNHNHQSIHTLSMRSQISLLSK